MTTPAMPLPPWHERAGEVGVIETLWDDAWTDFTHAPQHLKWVHEREMCRLRAAIEAIERQAAEQAGYRAD